MIEQMVAGARGSNSRASEAVFAVEFASSVYSIDAVKRAAYAFMARATVLIEPLESAIRCTLQPAGTDEIEILVRDFRREVLDQDLRIDIEAKTEGLRNLVLGLAFSRVSQRE